MNSGRSQDPLWCGFQHSPAARTALRAGPLALFFEDGGLRYIRLGGQEVLRRIYVAVRDDTWRTVPVRISDLDLRAAQDSFRITFLAEHCEGGIAFQWRGMIEGTPEGFINFEMRGEALTTFMRNRIGICVLHPAEGCAGRSCAVEKTDGSVQHGSFAVSISPHQPFKDVRAIEHEPVHGVKVRVEFRGDVFEMEDQRNWTDDSFKTYSTPLELPFPMEIRSGTRVEQSVVVRLNSSVAFQPAVTSSPRFSVEMSRRVRIPRIGLGSASHGEELSSKEISRLAALRLSHLRVDLFLSHAGWVHYLEQAASQAGRLGIDLEVALFLSDPGNEELQQLAARIAQLGARIDSWMILRPKRQPVPATWISRVREILGPAAPGARFGSGTDGFYAEWNRQRPAFEILDFSCYSVNPQVHADDNSTLVENLQGLRQTVSDAARKAGDVPLAVSPVTLRPRPPSGLTLPARSSGERTLPPGVDARQASLFGAGWTACSLKYLAARGLRSITYYETTGWRGVMEREGGTPASSSPSSPGCVFPLYHVLADFGDYAGGEVIDTFSNDPLSFDGVALTCDGRIAIILASWIPEPQKIVVTGMPAVARVRRLTASGAKFALEQPENYRGSAGYELAPSDGRVEVELEPFEVARLEIPCKGN